MFEENRIKNLIDERIEYENDFIIVEDIIKSDEMDYQIAQMQFFIDNLENNPYDFDNTLLYDYAKDFASEQYLNQLREDKLIEERLEYEKSFYEDIEEPVDFLDIQIEELENPQFFECPYEDEYYFEEYNMNAYYCGSNMRGYIVSDDPFDSLGGCDYPEGPSENLEGFFYPEPVYDCFPDPDYDFGFEEDLMIMREIEANSINHDLDWMENLIKEHLEEEEKFFEYLKENEFIDEYHIPFLDEEIILC